MADCVVLHGEAEFGFKVDFPGRDLAELKPLAGKAEKQIKTLRAAAVT